MLERISELKKERLKLKTKLDEINIDIDLLEKQERNKRISQTVEDASGLIRFRRTPLDTPRL